MGLGTSIVVFAIGAVMRFAVTVSTTGFNIHTVGVILMIVGALGFLLSLAFWSSWGGFGGYSRRRTVYSDGVPAAGYRTRTARTVDGAGTVVEEEHRSTY
jgi:hypothetical protein